MRELPRKPTVNQLIADGNRQKPPLRLASARNFPTSATTSSRQLGNQSNNAGNGEREDRAGSSVSTDGNASDSDEDDERNGSTEVTESSTSDSSSDSEGEEGQRAPLEPISEEVVPPRKLREDEENGLIT
ncbi:hypothetical protein DMENIID0001_056010 [Sergentomyia squamirostris]